MEIGKMKSNLVILSALALLGALGCTSTSVDKSDPKLVQVIAIDQNGIAQPTISKSSDGTSATIQAPTSSSTIALYFSKVMDGSSIQVNPGDDFCTLNDNIKVSAKDDTGAAVPTFAAEVCYDPGGSQGGHS